MGKGSGRRPKQITSAESDLRWELKEGKISRVVFNRRFAKLKRAGLLRRSGVVLK